MLVIALILYLLLISAFRILSMFGLMWWLDIPTPLTYAALLVLSLPLAYLIVYFVDVYHPRLRSQIARYLRPSGVRWMSILAVLATGGGLLYVMLTGDGSFGWFSVAVLIPVGVVSLLNFMGFEILTRRLSGPPTKHTVPPLFFVPPLPPTTAPGPELAPEDVPPQEPGSEPTTIPTSEDTPPADPAPDEPDTSPDVGPEPFPGAKLDPVPESERRPLPDGMVLRTYTWDFKGKQYSVDVQVSQATYSELHDRTRDLSHGRWSDTYVSRGVTAEIRSLASQLFNMGPGYGSYSQVSFVLSFVQSVVTYTRDVGEYPKYPIETLFEAKGDCEDFSIIGAAILKCMGYEVALLFCPGHAALGVGGADGLPGAYIQHEGHRYYYCEMTARGWNIGDVPPSEEGAPFEVSPVSTLAPRVVLPEDIT